MTSHATSPGAVLLADTLQQNGYSVTRTRQRVFGALEHQEPQTMNEIITSLAGVVDRASVYRTIALFEQLGIVQRLQIGWKYKIELSDRFSHHHHHLTCIVCGAIVALREDLLLEANLRGIALDYQYKPVAHQLEIQGVCPKCQPKNQE